MGRGKGRWVTGTKPDRALLHIEVKETGTRVFRGIFISGALTLLEYLCLPDLHVTVGPRCKLKEGAEAIRSKGLDLFWLLCF